MIFFNPIISHEFILFGFYACAVSLSVISFKHSGGKELIHGGVLREHTTTEGGQSKARMTMTAQTTTPSQIIDVAFVQAHSRRQSFGLIIERVQRDRNTRSRTRNTAFRVSGRDQHNFTFTAFPISTSFILNFEPLMKGTQKILIKIITFEFVLRKSQNSQTVIWDLKQSW